MTPDSLRDVLAEALHPILEAVRAETLRAAAHALSQGLQYDGPQSVMFLQDLANRHASADWPVRIESGEPERQADALAPTVARLIADARAEAGREAYEDGYDQGHADAHADGAAEDDLCRYRNRGRAEQAAADRERVEAACAKAEVLTQEAMGHRSKHWRGIDYADGLDSGIETTTGLVRAALDSEGGTP
jgi:hypothetical protein